jgi:excisionase family DNA binding protein
MPTETTRRLLSLDEAAEQLGCTRRHIYQLIERQALTSVRIPGPDGKPHGHKVEQAEIDAFIERNRSAS